MHNLGQTRSCNRRDHRLQTPDTFVRTPLPCLTGGLAVVHAAPGPSCAFAQYTVEFGDKGGTLHDVLPVQRFVYVLDGTVLLETDRATSPLKSGSYTYLSPGVPHTLRAGAGSRIAVIERAATAGATDPRVIVSDEEQVPATPLMGDPDVQVRTLLPEAPDIDFAVNTMTYQPGASLPMVEVHVMEHGLLMLAGGGIYRLGEAWYPVDAGDFIWMAPFCPQWFGALGRQPTKYLIYKDWNCHPLAAGRSLLP